MIIQILLFIVIIYTDWVATRQEVRGKILMRNYESQRNSFYNDYTGRIIHIVIIYADSVATQLEVREKSGGNIDEKLRKSKEFIKNCQGKMISFCKCFRKC